MTPAVLTEFLLNGLVLGALYVLMALGLSIIFGMVGVINFAHGALFTLGAYTAYQVRHSAGSVYSSPPPSDGAASGASPAG